MAKWEIDGYDEMGSYYFCPKCGYGIVVEEDYGDWTPGECPNCKAKMKGVNYGEDD